MCLVSVWESSLFSRMGIPARRNAVGQECPTYVSSVVSLVHDRHHAGDVVTGAAFECGIDQRFGEKILRHELFGESGVKATIILFPTVMGVSDLERGFANRLAGLGYAALVADLTGGKSDEPDDDDVKERAPAARTR